jgi:hypothetical protein
MLTASKLKCACVMEICRAMLCPKCQPYEDSCSWSSRLAILLDLGAPMAAFPPTMHPSYMYWMLDKAVSRSFLKERYMCTHSCCNAGARTDSQRLQRGRSLFACTGLISGSTLSGSATGLWRTTSTFDWPPPTTRCIQLRSDRYDTTAGWVCSNKSTAYAINAGCDFLPPDLSQWSI